MPEKKKKQSPGPAEDTTRFEEFVPSFNAWLSAERQSERAEDLEQEVDE